MDPSDQNNNPASSLSSRSHANYLNVVENTTKTACAACKYHKRKCTPECLLAQYFPAGKSKVFENVHKIFGETKIKKKLMELDPTQKDNYIGSIIYEANMWVKDPVQGCYGEIFSLRHQLCRTEMELQAVRQQLEIYRQYYDQHHHQQLPDQWESGITPWSNNNGLQLYQMPQPQDCNNLVAATSLPMSQHHHQQHEAYDNLH